MGPPSSGATTVFAILKQLERFDLRALGRDNPAAWHLIAESMRLAYADRDAYLGDPDFVAVPVAGLTDPAYLAARSLLISPDRAIAARHRRHAAGRRARAPRRRSTSEAGTSHFVAVDGAGNVASYTSTIESVFGSGLTVNGMFLNNELTDFSFAPERDGAPVANRVEGGKRPRSSMSPTIVYGPDGQVRLAVGAAGGTDDHRPGRQGDHRRDRLGSVGAGRDRAAADHGPRRPGHRSSAARSLEAMVAGAARRSATRSSPSSPATRPMRSSASAAAGSAPPIRAAKARWVAQ